MPSVLAEGTEKIWPAIENYILVGHVLEVTDAPSFAECLIACLHAEQDFGFLCKSAMWYPVDDDQVSSMVGETWMILEKVYCTGIGSKKTLVAQKITLPRSKGVFTVMLRSGTRYLMI